MVRVEWRSALLLLLRHRDSTDPLAFKVTTPMDLLLAEPKPPAAGQVSVRSDDGRTAVLAVTSHGSVEEVHLVREGGRWRVVVPALEKSGDG